MTVTAKLALGKSFMESLSRLPKKIQKKAREALTRFIDDPTSSGQNFERLPGFADDKVRSLRVDQTYRMILVQPPRGDVFLAVWVDHHDEAYRWARAKTFEVNPRSGVFQVYSEEEGREAVAQARTQPAEAPRAEKPNGLFDPVDDEDLLLGGVPAPLLASVRTIETEAELDALEPHLPREAADILYLLAAGSTFEQALEEASRPRTAPAAVDVEDIEASLALPASKESFRVVEGEGELEQMLLAPLEQWRVFLHPSQRKLVEWRTNGPIRVLGGAGTGKTVVLIHRARFLATEVFTAPGERILVTTFTRNLAADIEAALRSLLAPGEVDAVMGRVDVVNLHAWARRAYETALGTRVAVIESESERRRRMEEATIAASGDERPVAFYLEEWDQVVQGSEAQTRADYFRARRTGRGTPLSRAQRADVWRVFETYRAGLREAGLVEWQDVVREVRLHLAETEQGRPRYRAVLADEVQDFSNSEIRLLRALVPDAPDNMFLVGDAHQRIYGHMQSLGKAGIEIRGRSRRLRLNYRTTEEIRARAVAVLEGIEVDDMDGGVDSFTGYRSLRSGPAPEIHRLERASEEDARLVELVRRWREEVGAEAICVAARTKAALERYEGILRDAGIATQRIKGSAAASGAGVRTATMHRLKGLEFPRVIIAGVHEGLVPLTVGQDAHGDALGEEEHLKRERCLFYVAATRARDALAILGAGPRSPFL